MVYLNEHFTKDTNPATRMLLESLEEMSQPIGYLSRNCRLQNHASEGQADYEIDVLWPPRDHPSCELDKNDSSLVLRISDENGSMLLCGDIGKIPQQLLMELEGDDPGRLKADLLLLPHHGSISVLIPEFVHTVGPQVCINSCGFIRQRSLDKLHHFLPDQKILHTYNTGAVTATLTPSGVKASTYR
jgi:beta-lactamase superfamily II metal-dependent hydrolase